MNEEFFESAEVSDLGKRRKNNEDACILIPAKGMYCVADGMGGTVGGDLASEAITTNIAEVFNKSTPEETETLGGRAALFTRAVNKASKWIKNYSDEKAIGQMGSTVVGFLLDPRNPTRAVGLHAGDSRLYRFRNGALEQLTHDHSAVAALAAKLGRDPASLPAKFQNELLRAVGLTEVVELDKTPVEVRSKDVFLLCSDGLTKMMTDKEIAEVIKLGIADPIGKVAQKLIDDANAAGGKDNVTVMLIRVGDISKLPVLSTPEEEEVEAATMGATSFGTQTSAPSTAKREHDSGRTPDTSEITHGHTPLTPADIKPQKQIFFPPPPKPKPNPLFSPRNLNIAVGVALLIVLVVGIEAFRGSHRAVFIAAVDPALPINSTNEPIEPPPVPTNTVHPPAVTNTPVQTNPPATQPADPGTVTNVHHTNPPPVVVPVIVYAGLTIESDPSGADVLLAGQKVGTTPYFTNLTMTTPLAYSFGTLTHTGSVVATAKLGATNTIKVPLTLRPATVMLASDPAGAELFVDNNSKGTAAQELPLMPGKHQFMAKYPGLPDVAVTVDLSAGRRVQTNLVFTYGGVVVESVPTHAQIFATDGKPLGVTPYTNAVLPVGSVDYQLAASNYLITNLSLAVASHLTHRVVVQLQHGSGTLSVRNSFAGLKLTLDDQPAMMTTSNTLSVEAGNHVLVADYQGKRLTNSFSLQMNDTREIILPFEAPKPPPVITPVTNVVQAAVTNMPSTTPVVTNVEVPIIAVKTNAPAPEQAIASIVAREYWTNQLGIVFVRVPGADFWTGTVRVTPSQYAAITGKAASDEAQTSEDGQSFVVGFTHQDANALVNEVAAAELKPGKFPPAFEGGHYALPTTAQWSWIVKNDELLGIRIKNFIGFVEWCSNENGQPDQGICGRYSPGLKTIRFVHGDPDKIAVRLMLVH